VNYRRLNNTRVFGVPGAWVTYSKYTVLVMSRKGIDHLNT